MSWEQYSLTPTADVRPKLLQSNKSPKLVSTDV